MDKNTIQRILNQTPELKAKLYAKGFFLTDSNVDDSVYPFYGIWNKNVIDRFTLLAAQKERVYIKNASKKTLILVGHAYDPVKHIADENTLLEHLMSFEFPSAHFWASFNNLTGIFTMFIIENGMLYIIGDATGMQTTFYGTKNGYLYVSSHTNCIGDILGLEWDEYIKKLVKYHFFNLLGNSLPGNLTQFREVKRLIPNHYICVSKDNQVSVKRFYWPTRLPISEEEIVSQVSRIMHSNLDLITKKWKKPAISMTGGCDSKTTLSCAAGLYDNFRYFSYISSKSEKADADAAHKICNSLGLPHKIYQISDNDSDFDNIEKVRAVLFWNTGGIRFNNKNDVRKRIAFADTEDFDVEVKSWASEIGRSYYSKRFNGRTDFGKKPTPRACTTMYKFFLHNRKLVHDTDIVFKRYLGNYFEQSAKDPIEWQEQFFWEFRVSSWNGLVITGEHRYSFEITIPYNNRNLLQLLLSAPIDTRIQDRIYKGIRAKMNPKIDETGIAVQNLKHTKNREKAEGAYYFIHSNIPF